MASIQVTIIRPSRYPFIISICTFPVTALILAAGGYYIFTADRFNYGWFSEMPYLMGFVTITCSLAIALLLYAQRRARHTPVVRARAVALNSQISIGLLTVLLLMGLLSVVGI